MPVARPAALFINSNCSQFLVVVVIDGREKMSDSVSAYCSSMKLMDPSMLKLQHSNNEVTCHMFQRTLQLKRSNSPGHFQPLQVILAIKEKNGGKLNSHLWFFSGFVRRINPRVTFVSNSVPNRFIFVCMGVFMPYVRECTSLK